MLPLFGRHAVYCVKRRGVVQETGPCSRIFLFVRSQMNYKNAKAIAYTNTEIKRKYFKGHGWHNSF